MCSRDRSKCCLCGRPIDGQFFAFECFTLNKSHVHYDLAGAVAHQQCLKAYPGVAEFLEFYFAIVLDVFLHSEWALVPVGDSFVDCFDSTECQIEPPEYDSTCVVDALRSFGNFQRFDAGDECRLVWESTSESVEYVMESSGNWRGAQVEMACKPETFLLQWRHLHRQFGRIFLHNQDCAIFAPDYFESVYVNQPLRRLQSQIVA